MDNQIPYVAYESALARMERTNKRLWVICIIFLIALLVTNALWVAYETRMETVEEITEEYEFDVMQDGEDGNNNFVGRDGEIINGETED